MQRAKSFAHPRTGRSASFSAAAADEHSLDESLSRVSRDRERLSSELEVAEQSILGLRSQIERLIDELELTKRRAQPALVVERSTQTAPVDPLYIAQTPASPWSSQGGNSPGMTSPMVSQHCGPMKVTPPPRMNISSNEASLQNSFSNGRAVMGTKPAFSLALNRISAAVADLPQQSARGTARRSTMPFGSPRYGGPTPRPTATPRYGADPTLPTPRFDPTQVNLNRSMNGFMSAGLVALPTPRVATHTAPGGPHAPDEEANRGRRGWRRSAAEDESPPTSSRANPNAATASGLYAPARIGVCLSDNDGGEDATNVPVERSLSPDDAALSDTLQIAIERMLEMSRSAEGECAVCNLTNAVREVLEGDETNPLLQALHQPSELGGDLTVGEWFSEELERCADNLRGWFARSEQAAMSRLIDALAVGDAAGSTCLTWSDEHQVSAVLLGTAEIAMVTREGPPRPLPSPTRLQDAKPHSHPLTMLCDLFATADGHLVFVEAPPPSGPDAPPPRSQRLVRSASITSSTSSSHHDGRRVWALISPRCCSHMLTRVYRGGVVTINAPMRCADGTPSPILVMPSGGDGEQPIARETIVIEAKTATVAKLIGTLDSIHRVCPHAVEPLLSDAAPILAQLLFDHLRLARGAFADDAEQEDAADAAAAAEMEATATPQ
jgi:hypothetical protein